MTSATFVKADSATEGSWIGVYGSEAYDLVDSSSSVPDATITPSGQSTNLWTNTTTNTPALQIPGSNYRVAAAWYSSTSFTVDVDVTDGQAHDLALYFLDYQGGNARSEQVTLSNASTGVVLDSQLVSSFSNGVYRQWQISGNVLITFKCLGGANAVLSGLFIDPPSLAGYSPFSQPLQVTAGSPVDVLSAQALTPSPTQGQTFTATIALFTDSNVNTLASSFTATINWGDWMTTLGTVSGGSGSFSVQGTHTYSAFGNFPINVQITLGSPVTATASTVSTAAVAPPSSEVSLSSYYNEVGITTTGSSTKGGWAPTRTKAIPRGARRIHGHLELRPVRSGFGKCQRRRQGGRADDLVQLLGMLEHRASGRGYQRRQPGRSVHDRLLRGFIRHRCTRPERLDRRVWQRWVERPRRDFGRQYVRLRNLLRFNQRRDYRQRFPLWLHHSNQFEQDDHGHRAAQRLGHRHPRRRRN